MGGYSFDILYYLNIIVYNHIVDVIVQNQPIIQYNRAWVGATLITEIITELSPLSSNSMLILHKA